MVIFKNFQTKSDPNVHQNAPNCTILKKFSLACPRTPYLNSMSLRDMQISISKKIILAPPLPNPSYVPENNEIKKREQDIDNSLWKADLIEN